MDGQEPLGEDEKTAAMKKARFAAISKTFYDPINQIFEKKISRYPNLDFS